MTYLEEARTIASQFEDSLSYASALNTLGNVQYELGFLAAARALFDESTVAYSKTLDPQYHVFNGAMLSRIAVIQDEGRV